MLLCRPACQLYPLLLHLLHWRVQLHIPNARCTRSLLDRIVQGPGLKSALHPGLSQDAGPISGHMRDQVSTPYIWGRYHNLYYVETLYSPLDFSLNRPFNPILRMYISCLAPAGNRFQKLPRGYMRAQKKPRNQHPADMSGFIQTAVETHLNPSVTPGIRYESCFIRLLLQIYYTFIVPCQRKFGRISTGYSKPLCFTSGIFWIAVESEV